MRDEGCEPRDQTAREDISNEGTKQNSFCRLVGGSAAQTVPEAKCGW